LLLTPYLVGHATVTRGEDRRAVQLADLMLIDLENESPRPGETVPCMVQIMRQGKTNQHGKVEYMGCMRNIDPVLCPLSALALYFFFRWGRDGAGQFPSFRQPENYYNLYVLPGSVRVPARQLSYNTQADWSRRMFNAVGIQSKEKGNSPRKQAARHAELNGVPETDIRRAGRWNTDALSGVYLCFLPRAFMRSIAGFPQEGKGYFLPRAQEMPEEALCSRVWPDVDLWLERMEAYHPNRGDDNEVVRLDLAGTGFLRLLRELRVVLLQDSVILRKQFPLHPLWKDSLFNCPEYLRFAGRVETSLANVVTPAELTMQRYWPAQEAVAKLRHEANMLCLRGLQSRIEELLERVGQMERSAAAFAPIWIQQGGTGIWVGPTAFAHQPHPHPPPPPPPPPDSPPPSPPGPTSTPASAPAPPPTQDPFVLDPQAPARPYKMLRGSDSVLQLWTEWTLGLNGGPSIEALDRCWGARWRVGSEAMFYSRRLRVMKEIRRRVDEGTARGERQAVDQLEQLRGQRSLHWLCTNIQPAGG
jgi:hypothetical protein